MNYGKNGKKLTHFQCLGFSILTNWLISKKILILWNNHRLCFYDWFKVQYKFLLPCKENSFRRQFQQMIGNFSWVYEITPHFDVISKDSNFWMTKSLVCSLPSPHEYKTSLPVCWWGTSERPRSVWPDSISLYIDVI